MSKLKLYRILYLEGELSIAELDEGLVAGAEGNLVYKTIELTMDGLWTPQPSSMTRIAWHWNTTCKLIDSDVDCHGAYPLGKVGDPVTLQGIHDLDFAYEDPAHRHRKRGHSLLLQNGRWSIIFQEIRRS